jgi:hypothetical protein
MRSFKLLLLYFVPGIFTVFNSRQLFINKMGKLELLMLISHGNLVAEGSLDFLFNYLQLNFYLIYTFTIKFKVAC